MQLQSTAVNTRWKVFAKSKQSLCRPQAFFWNRKVARPTSLWQKYSNLVAHADYPSTMLPKWQKHLPHKLHSQHFTFQWKLLVTAKHGELFESKLLVCVQPLSTRLCLLHVHKHGFILHIRFITINHWSAVHYDISLQQTSLQWYIVAIILFCFARYHCNEVSLEWYLGETSWRLYRYLADLSF